MIPNVDVGTAEGTGAGAVLGRLDFLFPKALLLLQYC